MYRGSLQDFYWEKGTYECLDVPCVHFYIKRNDMKHYLTNILKSDTSSGDMNEKVYHWLYSFGKFHKKYIIMPLESLNSSFLEESFRKKTIAADVLFILENIRIYFQMDAGEFEGLLYTILSE